MRGVLLYARLAITNTVSASLAVPEVVKYLIAFHKYQIGRIEDPYSGYCHIYNKMHFIIFMYFI